MSLRCIRRPGSENWYLRGTVRGVIVFESTKTADRGAAEALRIRREAEIMNRSVYGERATKTFLEAVDSYLDTGGEDRYLAPLVDRFGTTPLAQIGQAEIDSAAIALKPNAGPATRNRQIYTPLVAVLTHAAKRGWADFRRIERPKQPRGRVNWLRPEQAERIIEACAPHLRPLVIFMLGTGARVSEAVYLNWADVNLADRRVWFLDTKNGESRGVPLNDRVFVELSNLPHREGAVFRRPAWTRQRELVQVPYERRGDGGGPIKTAWIGALKRAGLADKVTYIGRHDGKKKTRWQPRYRPHDCRHTWATWVYAATRDLRALMELGGWKSERMVFRYTHVNPDHLAGAIDCLPWAESVQNTKVTQI